MDDYNTDTTRWDHVEEYIYEALGDKGGSFSMSAQDVRSILGDDTQERELEVEIEYENNMYKVALEAEEPFSTEGQIQVYQRTRIYGGRNKWRQVTQKSFSTSPKKLNKRSNYSLKTEIKDLVEEYVQEESHF